LNAARGLVLAAPSSGSGKTTISLGLMRAFARRGTAVAPAKSGPDYIDPTFHAAAARRTGCNLDIWAMRPETIAASIDSLEAGADLVLCEGAMGLYDGIDARGTGSTADLAARAGWPVVLIVDARGLAASAGPLVAGFVGARPDLAFAGVIFNRVGSPSHAALLREALALACPGVPCLGTVLRDPALALPERHLGLIPAGETDDLERFIDGAADACVRSIDLDALAAAARPAKAASTVRRLPLAPLGMRIAIARDSAFAFAYPAMIDEWRAAGAEISFFSPLADEAPDATCDAVFLPGGYPELHAGRLAQAENFTRAMRRFQGTIYGECGGYMTLGQGLVDARGTRHAMLGLLPVETSFAQRRLHLGYREMRVAADCALGAAGTVLRGHEFHYASVVSEPADTALFAVSDARGQPRGPAGCRSGRVAGSFLHVIDRAGHSATCG